MWVSLLLLLGTWMASCQADLSNPRGLGVKSGHVSRPLTRASQGSPWPMPQSLTVFPDVYTLAGESDFMFTPAAIKCDDLYSAFDRYNGIIFYGKPQVSKKPRSSHPRKTFSDTELSGLQVDIHNPCTAYPVLDSDESYNLDVAAPFATLTASTIWGALRGLETFSQLIYEADNGLLLVNRTTIADKPRFKHRGYMVDSSRHYLSMSSIYKSLDALAYNKFNVFHWHIVDDQSFPYESAAFPIMNQKNAFDQHHVYTRENVKQVIEYARQRGIRVVPEFDTPGHTQSWGAIPDLLTPCYDAKGQLTGAFGPINPTLNSTYEFLKTFFAEVVDLFPDKYVHMGGDEVSFACWQSNPYITEFMQAQQFGKNYSKLEQYYEQRLLDDMAQLKAGYIVWQEVIDNEVKVRADTVVNVWKEPFASELSKVTAKGFQSLLSTPWYLNYAGNPYGQDWKGYYQVEPTNFNGTEAQKALIIGGEVCMWGEYVDSTNIIQRTWPRASAVGERLWSAKDVTSVTEAAPRLLEHRCRMVRRGLQAEPVTGPSFCKYEYED